MKEFLRSVEERYNWLMESRLFVTTMSIIIMLAYEAILYFDGTI